MLKNSVRGLKVTDQEVLIHAVFVFLLRRQSPSLHSAGKSWTMLNLRDHLSLVRNLPVSCDSVSETCRRRCCHQARGPGLSWTRNPSSSVYRSPTHALHARCVLQFTQQQHKPDVLRASDSEIHRQDNCSVAEKRGGALL